MLANETRLKLLHALVRKKTMCVTELAESLRMKPQAVSNQLQRLVDRRIVKCRRLGNQIFYQISDPCIPILLDKGWCLIEESRGRIDGEL